MSYDEELVTELRSRGWDMNLQEDIKAELKKAGYDEGTIAREPIPGFLVLVRTGHPGCWEVRYRHYRSGSIAGERAAFFNKTQPLLEAKYGDRVSRRYEGSLLVALIVAPPAS